MHQDSTHKQMKLWDDQKPKEALMRDCDIYNSNKHKTKTYNNMNKGMSKSKEIHLYLAINRLDLMMFLPGVSEMFCIFLYRFFFFFFFFFIFFFFFFF